MFKIKTIITLAFICFSFFANAQFEKGKFTIGTGVTPNIKLGSGQPSLTLNINELEFGYFLKNRWEVGASGNLDVDNFYFKSTFLSSRTNYSLNAYSRYYFKDKKFTPYVEAFLGGGKEKGLFIEANDEITYDRYNLRAALGIGASYKIGKRFAVNGGLRYGFNTGLESSLRMKYSF